MKTRFVHAVAAAVWACAGVAQATSLHNGSGLSQAHQTLDFEGVVLPDAHAPHAGIDGEMDAHFPPHGERCGLIHAGDDGDVAFAEDRLALAGESGAEDEDGCLFADGADLARFA